eukprot:TRINITY_DN82343_c0_g1_i1.p1 TRINITY_DN82343_c0_g1~~TRINITY_DN82343_c0_g1_i1.p1  ORF type:complete len:675 (-),score=156.04 TRINITY_DN82343_c0_g1_i1:176-2200(-)
MEEVSLSWSALNPLPEEREACCAVDYDGYVYVLGGQKTSHGSVVDVERVLRQSHAAWEELPACDVAKTWFSVNRIGHKAVVCGGFRRTGDGKTPVQKGHSLFDFLNGRVNRCPDSTFGFRAACCSASDHEGKIFVFGGVDKEQKYLNELLIFSMSGPNSFRWSEPIPIGTIPPRANASMVFYEKRLWVYGGVLASKNRVADLYSMNIDGGEIHRFSVRGLAARTGHSAVMFKQYMVIFGGIHGGRKDLQIVDLSDPMQPTLLKVELTGHVRPRQRAYHGACLVEKLSCLVVVGGRVLPSGPQSKEAFRLDLRPLDKRSKPLMATLLFPNSDKKLVDLGKIGKFESFVSEHLSGHEPYVAYISHGRWMSITNHETFTKFCINLRGDPRTESIVLLAIPTPLLTPKEREESEKIIRSQMIGAGGQGKVLLEYLSSGREVAVKYIPIPASLKDISIVENEVNMLRSLRHPHIVQFYDARIVDRSKLLIMEFLPGGDLETKLASMWMAMKDDIFRYEKVVSHHVRRLLTALDYLHKRGIIHGDIKGKNIVFDSQGFPKLIDFGSAFFRQQTDDSSISFKGTTNYAAPEVCSNPTFTSDKSDVYSLGCVAFEMLARHPPWEGVMNIWPLKTKTPKDLPPLEIPEGFSDDAKDFVAQCTTIDPDKRPSVDALFEHRWIRA